ncbi:MAG: TRAP transporter substrate-binding protein DctP [Deltaproteobacteria bacterium]|nr:TRAP transporter substrate-binding protein DctP [Deltaproteobacteria bacterium]
MKRSVSLLVIVLGLALVFTPVYAKGPIKLKMVTFLPKGDTNMTAWMAFVKDVNTKAKGELEIVYTGGPEAIPGFKQFEALRNGVVDMIYGCESYYGREVTGAAYTHLTRLDPMKERETGYYDFRADLFKKHNIHYLGRAEFGVWFQIFTNKKVNSPKELSGQKIRVSATYEPFVRKLGAVPVTIPGGEIYTALERGTIDGYAWSVLGNIQSGWVEVCKYILEPRIYQMNIEGLVNLKSWEKLPPHLQKLMTECMIENEKNYTPVMADISEKEFKEMQKRGMEVITFSPQDSKWYVDLAYEAGWDEIIKQNPDLGPRLKKMLTP